MGKTVRLELDVRERDRYQRLLAYVYVGDLMVNAELVRLGYAHAVTVPPNVAHASRLREPRAGGPGSAAGASGDGPREGRLSPPPGFPPPHSARRRGGPP